MYIKIKVILIFFCLFCADTFGQQHFVRNYTTANGLHSNACTFVKLDRYGYLWFGHKNGMITRYDAEFNTYFIEREEQYNINCLDINEGGEVWVGNNGKGIALWAQRNWYFFDKGYGFNFNTITKGIFCDDANAEIVLAVKDTLRVYDIVSPRKIDAAYTSIPLAGILKFDRLNETSAIVTTTRGIYLYEDQKLQALSSAFVKDEIIEVDQIAKDRWVITTPNAVYEVAHRTLQLALIRVIPFSHNNRFTASEFENNRLYTAAKGEGVFMFDFDKGTSHLYTSSNGLNELDITDIAVDKEGYVYVSTEANGVSILGLDYVLNFQNVPLFNDGLNACIYTDQENNVWVGKQKEQIIKHTAKVNEVYTIKNHAIHTIFEYESSIYATTNFGVFYLENGTFIKDSRFPSANCSGSLVDSQGRLWLSFTDNIGIYCLIKERIKIYEPGKLGLPFNNAFLRIAESPNKIIGFATKNKCFVFNGTQFQSISNSEWKNISINDFDFDDYGNIWLATNNGLYNYSNSKLQKINSELDSLSGSPVLIVNIIRRIKGTGKMFVGTKQGIFELSIGKSGNITQAYYYNDEFGIENTLCLDKVAHVTNKGNIYFATQSGLYLLPENHDKPVNYFYDVFLSYIKVKYDDIKKFKAENYFLDRSKRNFRFEFESGSGTFELNLRDLSKSTSRIIGRSRLMPDETTWLNRNTSTFSYGFLSPGLHTFQYQAYNRFKGQYEPPITIELYFKGAWYQSIWFFVLVFLFLAIGFFFIIRSFRSYDKERVYKYNLASDVLNFQSNRLVIIVGAVFMPAAALIFKIFEPGIDNLFWLNLLIGSFLAIYYVGSMFIPKWRLYSQTIILVGLYVFTIVVFILCYHTKLHPYYFVGQLLIVFASLSILNYVGTIKWYLISFCCMALIVYFSVETTTYSYNKNLFIIGILFTIIVLIMNLVIKLNVQEKLLFSDDIVNNSSSLVMSGDMEGNIKFSSKNFESILGYTKEEIHGGKWWEISSRSIQDAEHNKNFVLQKVKEHEPYVRPVRTKSGAFKYIQWVDKKINENLIVSVGQDITDKKELEDKFQFLLQNAEDGFFQTNERGLVIFTTDKILDITGLKMDEVIGTYYHDFIRADYTKKIIMHYMRQLKHQILATYIEFPVKRLDGKEIWVGQTAKMIYNDDNKFLGFIAVTRDITDKRKVEEIVKQTNKDFNDNLMYSKHMQDALLPNHNNLQKYLRNIFQIAIPRDIVSGDFSFIERLDKHIIVAVGDCTGHGFTGAFMTVLGTNILKSLVTKKSLLGPNEILMELDKQIDHSLNKDNQDNDHIMRDGMEIGLCIFDLEHKTMQFAGAGLSLYYTMGADLQEMQGDFKQIGNLDIENFQYTNQSLSYESDMNFYMFSDGFQDQFGGPLKKKFSRKRIKQVLTDMQSYDLSHQKGIIENTFSDWKGSFKQTDDFIFLGFNLKD